MANKESIAKSVGKRYASSLFEVVKEADQLATTEKIFVEITELQQQSDDFKELLYNRIVPTEAKRAVLTALLDKLSASQELKNFFQVVADHNRLGCLNHMIEAFNAMHAEHNNQLNAIVISSEPLTDEQIQQVQKALENTLSKKILVQTEVDPSILGGLIVKVGSYMLDDSVRTKIEALRLMANKKIAEL